MQATEKNTIEKHISFEYTSFDRVVLHGYVQRLLVEGSVINMLCNFRITDLFGFKMIPVCSLRLDLNQGIWFQSGS